MNGYLITYIDQSLWNKGKIEKTLINSWTIGSAICDVLTTGINIEQIIAVELKEESNE
jgi:hypothetical protein